MHEFPLITDLALILIAAGCTSVICRIFKLPILVGYILAGLLAGPHIALIPTVHDVESIKTWSEIGVIFLLFALGLEFNFKSLLKVGKSGAITVAVIVSGMMGATLAVGHFLNWNLTTSIFMGGILCISSTMVIVKAFEELKLKGKHFTNIVYGVEIMEDIVGILMMVVLSSIAISQNANIVQEISTTTMRVVFFLVLWFVGGIFIVPTLLRKLKPWLDDEILLTISLGLCLGMVMLADASNLSTALGAFTIGSILGATTEAHRIEHIMTPIKNLFGAIFFVSVGMMVVPSAILDNIGTLLILLAIELILNPILGALGVFLSGKSLHDSLNAGACFGQIGEFSFIIANLGVSLAVLDEFTYPIVITISAITMITTPYVIKYSEKLVEPISRLLPERLKYRVEEERAQTNKKPDRKKVLIQHFLAETFVLSMLLLGIISFLNGFAAPLLKDFIAARGSADADFISRSICIVLTLITLTPFLSALILRRNQLNRAFMVILLRGTGNTLFKVLQSIRILVVLFFICFALYTGSPFPLPVNIAIAVILLVIVSFLRIAFKNYIRLEQQFLLNYNEVELEEHQNDTAQAENIGTLQQMPTGAWFAPDVNVTCYRADEDSPFIGKSLTQLNLRAEHNLFIIRIQRGDQHINLPAGQEIIQTDDIINIAGRTSDIRKLESPPYLISDKKLHQISMKQFSNDLQEDHNDAPLRCICIPIYNASGLCGVSLRESGITAQKCLVIGIEAYDRVSMNPAPDTVIEPNSRLWVIGESDNLARLLEQNLVAQSQSIEMNAVEA